MYFNFMRKIVFISVQIYTGNLITNQSISKLSYHVKIDLENKSKSIDIIIILMYCTVLYCTVVHFAAVVVQ